MGMRGTVQPQWVPARCWMEQNGEERHAEMHMVHGDILSHAEMRSSEIAGRPETVINNQEGLCARGEILGNNKPASQQPFME